MAHQTAHLRFLASAFLAGRDYQQQTVWTDPATGQLFWKQKLWATLLPAPGGVKIEAVPQWTKTAYHLLSFILCGLNIPIPPQVALAKNCPLFFPLP
jgi:hypothetical protein